MSVQPKKPGLFFPLLVLALLQLAALVGTGRTAFPTVFRDASQPVKASAAGATPTPTPTALAIEMVSLPLIKMDSSTGASLWLDNQIELQEDSTPAGPTPTITPTPLPPQTGLTNLPIVLGATMIMLVILAAWLIVGLRPKGKRP